jgi:hypothetical protein
MWNPFKSGENLEVLYLLFGSLVYDYPPIAAFQKSLRINLKTSWRALVSSQAHHALYRKFGIDPSKNEVLLTKDKSGFYKDLLVGIGLWKAVLNDVKQALIAERITATTMHCIKGWGGGLGTAAEKLDIVGQFADEVFGCELVFDWCVLDPVAKLKDYQLNNLGGLVNLYSPAKRNKHMKKKLLLQNIYPKTLMNPIIAKAMSVVSLGLHKSPFFEYGDITHWLPNENNFVGVHSQRLGIEPNKTVNILARNLAYTQPLVEVDDPVEFIRQTKRLMVFGGFNFKKVDPENFCDTVAEGIAREAGIDPEDILAVPVNIHSDTIHCVTVYPGNDINYEMTGVYEAMKRASEWVVVEPLPQSHDPILKLQEEMRRIPQTENARITSFEGI